MPLSNRFEDSSGLKARQPAIWCAAFVVGVIAIGYLIFIRSYTSPYAAGSDASGYLNIARLFSHGELTQPVARVDGLSPPEWDYYFQQPLGFTVNRGSGIMAPTYPVGLPLHLWLASMFVDLEYASILVTVVVSAAAGLLMMGLGTKVGLPWNWSLAGAAILWACPLYVFMGLQPMSDVPAMVWCMVAIWCALAARTRWPWAVATGAAVAMAVLVRPSNLLLVLPVAIVLGKRWWMWIALIFGGVPGALFLTWYNLRVYGHAFVSGYGDIRSAFALEYVPHNALHVARWIVRLLSPALPLALFGLPRVWRHAQPTVLLLLVWAGVFFLFYLSYYHTGETWWYLRFLLPAFPPIILLGLLGARSLTERLTFSSGPVLVPLAVFALVLILQVRLGRQLHVADVKRNDKVYVQLAEWMRTHAPTDAIVLQMQTSGAFLFYTSFTVVRWDLPPEDAQQRLYAAARAAGRPVYATLYDFEEKEAFAGRLSGVWKPLVRFGPAGIWQLASDSSLSR